MITTHTLSPRCTHSHHIFINGGTRLETLAALGGVGSDKTGTLTKV